MSMQPPSEPITVLFVDDEEAILRAISRVLERAPYEVLTVTSPLEALRVLSERRVDVLVSDIEMPEMNGLDLLQRVRKDYPAVLRMLLTGSATLERALHAINEGEVVRFFSKPFKVDIFRESMAALVERVERLRKDEIQSSLQARHQTLHRWLDRRYPGLLQIERTEAGEVCVDVDALRKELEAARAPELAVLLERGS